MQGIHRRPVNSPHKGPVTRKMFPFDDVIMPRNTVLVKSPYLMCNWPSIVCRYRRIRYSCPLAHIYQNPAPYLQDSSTQVHNRNCYRWKSYSAEGQSSLECRDPRNLGTLGLRKGMAVVLQMENDDVISLLALCEGNPPVTGEFPSQTASYVAFFSVHLASIRAWGWCCKSRA